MTPDQRFTFLLSGMGLLFTVTCVVLGLIWRTGRQTGKTLERVENIAKTAQDAADKLDRHIMWHLGRGNKA